MDMVSEIDNKNNKRFSFLIKLGGVGFLLSSIFLLNNVLVDIDPTVREMYFFFLAWLSSFISIVGLILQKLKSQNKQGPSISLLVFLWLALTPLLYLVVTSFSFASNST